MEIEFELLILLNVSILFSIAVLLAQEYKTRTIFSALSSLCWITLTLAFFASDPTFGAISWLFLGIAFIFILTTIYESLALLKENRWGTELK